MITLSDINTNRLNGRIQELTDVLVGVGGSKGDAAVIMHQEVRKLNGRILRFTPPPGLGSDAKEMGEKAVRRDLKKIFTPVTDDLLLYAVEQFGVSGIDGWITNNAGEKQHLKWDHIDQTGGHGMRAFHRKNRDSRGRTRSVKRPGQKPLWNAAYVVSMDAFSQHAKEQMARVGRRKAAWAIGFKELGGKVQRWIERHTGGAKGFVDNRLRDTSHPSITIGSSAAGVAEDAHTIHSALRVTYEAIGKRMRLIARGYAKDVKEGRKVTSKTGSEWVIE